MRVAALYDIHGNRWALEAVLAEIATAGVDQILVGGDVVLGPMPRETLELLNALGSRVRFLRGNTDRVIVVPPARGAEPDPWEDRCVWVAERLTPEQREEIRAWPETIRLELDGLGLTLFCHGTPRSDEEIVTPLTSESRLRDILQGVDAKTVVHGHTHIRYDRTFEGTRLVNPGSVGSPYEGEPGAYWGILGPGVELRRTAYDFARAAEEIRASGWPGADEFAEKNVLSSADPNEVATYFEKMAEEKARKTQRV